MLSVNTIKNDPEPKEAIGEIIKELHENGPVNNKVLEKLTYYKEFHTECFAEYEEKIISVLGLFYKNTEPSNLYSFILGTIGREYKSRYGEYLTPVQASIRNAVESKNSFLFQRQLAQENPFR